MFSGKKEGRKEGRLVVTTRSLQLLVGNNFLILWVILKAFSVSHFTLLDPEETFSNPALQMMNKCSLFQNNPTFLVSPYLVQSSVSLSFFISRQCICALDGNAIKIKNPNFIELEQFCEDFWFHGTWSETFRFPSLD
jgi:hypothetical protein